MGSMISKLKGRRRIAVETPVEPVYKHYLIYRKTWRRKHPIETVSNIQDATLIISTDPSLSYREYESPNKVPVKVRPIEKSDKITPPLPIRRQRTVPPKIQIAPRRNKTRSMPHIFSKSLPSDEKGPMEH